MIRHRIHHRLEVHFILLAGFVIGIAIAVAQGPAFPSAPKKNLTPVAASVPASLLLRAFVERYCVDCHDSETQKGKLDLEAVLPEDVSRHPEIWEKVVRKLRSRQMPPANKRRPGNAAYDETILSLQRSLDAAFETHPNPGRTNTLRRLTRTEYQNVIRDLLDLRIDATKLLPPDEPSHGFDNVTVGDLSPTLLDRYLSAAEKISRLAIGIVRRTPGGETIRLRPDLTQEGHVDGLPLGTRGGALIPHTFPQDGEYEIQIRLARDRNEEIEGLSERHEMELLLDRRRVAIFEVKPPPRGKGHNDVDEHLSVRFDVTAGPHNIGATFLKNPSSLLETRRQPYNAHFNFHRHPRISPAIFQVSIVGPFAAKGPGDTPSRRRIFVCKPTRPGEEEACAEHILSTLLRRAYRRPISGGDLEGPMDFYRKARADGDFDSGIEMALTAILVSPRFLFRIERSPTGAKPGTVYRVSDLHLASRLSFFLWSSIPDDRLLDTAVRGELGNSEVLVREVRRMLADPRSHGLVSNFAGQWLYLRNLASITPDLRLFPDFDDNLRQAFRQETELLFESILREDRSVLDLLQSDFTFLNERLAKHYGIPHIYGSRFRPVSLEKGSKRGGLLRHGSILTVTSYATRTSPVIRGHWILKNLLGSPLPPPPPDVPALEDNSVAANLLIREQLAEHRNSRICASCHVLMDPLGFALENFDAVGRWRDFEAGKPIDASGELQDGSKFENVSGLEEILLKRPEIFVATLTEKLLTFALGRGVNYYDAPTIRKIVEEARKENYNFSSLIEGIVTSVAFTMRKTQ